MVENRQTVNRIKASSSILYAKLGNITQALECKVFLLGQFIQLYLQFDTIIHTVRCTIWQATS